MINKGRSRGYWKNRNRRVKESTIPSEELEKVMQILEAEPIDLGKEKSKVKWKKSNFWGGK
jgi:hypothetical protein